MNVYTYSEARQHLAGVLKEAESTGKVLIRRNDGTTFALTLEKGKKSPLDVPSVKAEVSTKDVVSLVRKERGKARGLRV